MPNQDSPENPESESKPNPEFEGPDKQEEEDEDEDESSDESDSDSDDSSESEPEGDGDAEKKDKKEKEEKPMTYVRPRDEILDSDNSPETNIELFTDVLEGKTMRRRRAAQDRDYVFYEDLFDFPEDPENWREEDLMEYWADAPLEMTKPGWDPAWVDEEDWEIVRKEIAAGRDPPIAPFYVPFRKPYPVIPDNHYDIKNPKAVIEELDRIEEFLTWVSYIFPDGSSYEGTVWDDLAHGKGVYIANQGLVRYEGEWLQNNMEGHGVVEVDIPDIEPLPGSKLEAQMRAEGKIISRDYMSPEDREWLEMDIEDSIALAEGSHEIPFYERDEWVQIYGRKPEKGRYRYSGQWKHSRMHGCGVYVINERTIYGRFYFGKLLEDDYGCDADISAMHAGIAEVAAGKARMFVNKPDGMVREERGPYSDPQHPYFYEEEDVWMAPGFINQFYEVPDYWKTYVHEVDKEREMWLNSFYKSPLRLPMPAELEYWWEHDDTPEFVLVNTKEPEPDPKDPSKLVHTEDPLILHTPTGRLINYVDDEEHGIRLFWQPEDGVVDPEKVEFLPDGFDEFYGRDTGAKENAWTRFISRIENALKPIVDKIEKWTEEKKQASELKLKLIEKELELIEAELCLEEALEDMDEELKRREKEEQKKVEVGLEEMEDTTPSAKQDEKVLVEEEEEEEEEEDGDDDDDDDDTPSSFGSANVDQDPRKNDQSRSKPRPSPFSTSSLSFATRSLVSGVPFLLQQSFFSWKKNRSMAKATLPSCTESPSGLPQRVDLVSLPGTKEKLIPKGQSIEFRTNNPPNGRISRLRSLSHMKSHPSASVKQNGNTKQQRARSHTWLHMTPESELDNILSLHTPVHYLEQFKETKCGEPLSVSIF
ncbi:MORN motif [Parasponia andersonii]|uniref:MORN motif n=1 Tax=Parasponia andersonii TaxID=3476 RepID=A0A2P5BB55_PARAD|nr:MORN motif [Parasponia andersonii]